MGTIRMFRDQNNSGVAPGLDGAQTGAPFVTVAQAKMI